MSNTFKILANSLFGVMMTKVDKFKDFKIVTKESQVDKQIKQALEPYSSFFPAVSGKLKVVVQLKSQQ